MAMVSVVVNLSKGDVRYFVYLLFISWKSIIYTKNLTSTVVFYFFLNKMMILSKKSFIYSFHAFGPIYVPHITLLGLLYCFICYIGEDSMTINKNIFNYTHLANPRSMTTI